MKKIFTTILTTVFLIAWAIYCLTGISKNMWHYTFWDWIIILCFTMIPVAVCFWLLFKQSALAIPPVDKLSPDSSNEDPVDIAQMASGAGTAAEGAAQADKLIKIIQESYSICQKTINLREFENRLELATRNTYILERLEQNDFYRGAPSSEYFLDIFVRNRDELLNSFLKRAFYENLNKARNESKTQKGVVKRMDQFFLQIKNSSLNFNEKVILALKKEL